MYQLYSIVSFFFQSHAGKRMVGEWYLQVLTSWHVTHVGMQLSMLNGEPVGIFQCLPFCFTIKRCFWGWCFRCFPRKSLFWALVLLVLIVYVFALIFTQSAAWKHQNWLNIVDGVGMSHPYLMYKGKGGYLLKVSVSFFLGWWVGAIHLRGSPFVPIKLVDYPTRMQLWRFEIFGIWIEPGARSPSLPNSSNWN